MRIKQRFGSGVPLLLLSVLLAALPASVAFAELVKPDGIADGVEPPPHDKPLNLLQPCSQCHVRFDQWAESLYEIKKPTIATAADFQAVRDLQWQLAQALAIPCSGSCGHPTNYQVHPVFDQPCTLCHAKFLSKHSGIDMTLNEYDPAASCVGAGCHKDLKFLGDKIPYWSMAFAQVGQSPETATGLADLLARTQLVAPDLAPPAPIPQLAKAEGKWKHEIKSRLGSIVSSDLLPLALLLEDNLVDLSAYLAPVVGTLEGKVEAKTSGAAGRGNAELRTYVLEYDTRLKAIFPQLKESVMESKWKPAFPIEAMDLFISEVERRFKGEVLKERTAEKVVWTLDGGEISGELKTGETKITFKNLQANSSNNRFTSYLTALVVLSQLEKAYPEALLDEAKYAHTYSGAEDARWAIADAIQAYAATLPNKEFKYELKGAKDTETSADIAALLPTKVNQHAGEMILKLKSELKVKYDKPLEPEVKAEAAAAEAE